MTFPVTDFWYITFVDIYAFEIGGVA